jgi:predicted RNA-binding protein with PIN domain
MAGPEPSLAQPSLNQLRPALRLALDTARTLEARALPGKVRSVVRARRLPASWAVTMLEVLEQDAAFRARVAEHADAGALGEIPWLWLARPDGWMNQLEGLVEAAALSEEEDKTARLEQDRLLALEEELAQARAEISRLQTVNAELAASAEQQRKEMEGRLRSANARAASMLKDLEARDTTIASLEADKARLLDQLQSLDLEQATLEAVRVDAERATELLHQERGQLQATRAELDREMIRLRAEIRTRIGRAAGAGSELVQALADAADYLARSSPSERRVPQEMPVRSATEGPAAAAPRSRSERRPLPLPPAVFEDSTEAASYLVRAPGVQLVVDGYNVTFTSWSGSNLSHLRHRLVSALSELAVRLQRHITVVFDGADGGGRVASPAVARPWLRILFSASSVEADQVIVDTAASLPPDVPVVVATNDRQVQTDVRRQGANVITVEQLLAVLGRQAER